MRRNRLVPEGRGFRHVFGLCIVLACLVVISVTLIYLRKEKEEELQETKAEQARLQRLIEEETKRTETIENYKAYVQTKTYIEEIAREVLGLMYKDEILFKPADPAENDTGQE